MAFQFENLDSSTRQFMLQEIELDIAKGTLYMSKRFNSARTFKIKNWNL